MPAVLRQAQDERANSLNWGPHRNKNGDGVKVWGEWWGSNPRQPEPQSGALPTELHPPCQVGFKYTVFGVKIKKTL